MHHRNSVSAGTLRLVHESLTPPSYQKYVLCGKEVVHPTPPYIFGITGKRRLQLLAVENVDIITFCPNLFPLPCVCVRIKIVPWSHETHARLRRLEHGNMKTAAQRETPCFCLRPAERNRVAFLSVTSYRPPITNPSPTHPGNTRTAARHLFANCSHHRCY